LKVLVLNHNQENFGTYYRCLFHSRHLARRGHEVLMLCASGSTLDPLIRTKELEKGLKIMTLPRVKYGQYFSGQMARSLPALAQVLFGDYEVCHAFTVAQPQIAYPAWAARRLRGKRLIVDWDDLWGGGFAEAHAGLISRVLGWHERYFLQPAHHITYVSKKIGDEIEKAAERYPAIARIPKTLIPNGANTEGIRPLDQQACRRQLGIDPQAKILVSMANTYTESLQLMLEAFLLALETEPELKLYLVGEAPIPEAYQDLFQKVQHRTVRVGKVPFAQVPFYLGAADALVLPMEDNPIEEARFPMRFGDYLASGRPVVSNAVGEVKRYLNEYEAGLVSPPSDPKGLAENLVKVVQDPELARQCGARARALAEGPLNWDQVIDQVERIYRGEKG